ncbi:hypothetical protein A9G13_01675 [Gilliamella sp. wkB178]|uniref:vWA domain-containing protein n=1 Tax=Gilliamella sp. wkB178 TaxID=3120259 RepID=UPI00080E27B8|nr:VWA domain-containing protein [Gilliamella apicola]OCG08796.1 hypothetical protein A9G13_01675 [Gilliamella apicola]
MKFIKTLAIVGLSLFSFFSQAKVPGQIQIRSELASPIVLENSQDKNYLKISLTGVDFDSAKRVPINLALVIDRSGSMSGSRIEKAREAAILAINMLNEDDTISVVAFDSDAEIIIPATKVTNKQRLINQINSKVIARGGTALFAGLSKGINQVKKQLSKDKINRIILLSDGQANVGPSSVGELSELAVVAAKNNIAITTLGIGSDYNEVLMSTIASYSDGNHVFVDNTYDLENVFVREFKDVMSVVAQDVVINIQLKDGVKPVRLLGRDGSIKDNQVTVRMNQLYANQEKYLLLEVIPSKGKTGEDKTLAQVELKYDNLVANKTENQSQLVKIGYTNQPQVVKDSVIEDVVAETEIQKVTLDNEKALEMYNAGDKAAAQKMLEDNSNRLMSIGASMSADSAEAIGRLSQQASKNKAMADAIETTDEKVYRKQVTEKQYESKQGTIKK